MKKKSYIDQIEAENMLTICLFFWQNENFRAVFQEWEQVENFITSLNRENNEDAMEKSKNWYIIFLQSPLVNINEKMGWNLSFPSI